MEDIFYRILLTLDGIIYNLIDWVYDIFEFLAKLNLFGNEDYQQIVTRIYLVLGLIMLFALAYSLVRAVINPDDFAKGETSFPKLIQNIVVSLVIIAVLPTIFTVAYNIQGAILNNNTITKIVLGDEDNSLIAGVSSGRSLAFYTFQSFFHPNPAWCGNNTSIEECKKKITVDGFLGLPGFQNFKTIENRVLYEDYSFTEFKRFSQRVSSDQLTYTWLISTVAGIFVLYVLANFCFDMAVRVVKLMFYQIIAPIPVICRAIPFGGLKDVFSKWMKNTVSAFMEVFIRVAVLNFGVLMVKIVIENFSIAPRENLDAVQMFLARVMLIMGVIIFIRQAPKLIGDLFGLDSGNMKLGLREKLAQGGAFVAGGAAAAALGQIGRNATEAGKNVRNAKGFWGKTGAVVRGLGSATAGGLSAGTRAGWNARNAKNFTDARNAVSSGVATATRNRDHRADYRAEHASDLTGIAGWADTMGNVITGHVSDTVRNAGDWLGINNLDAIKKEKAFYKNSIIDMGSQLESTADEMVERDAIRDNAHIAKLSGGYTRSLGSMREDLDNKRKQKFREASENIIYSRDSAGNLLDAAGNITTDLSRAVELGREFTDYKGKTYQIHNESEYADYLAVLKTQSDKAKRDIRKYIERAAFGEDSIGKINGDALYGELMAKGLTSINRSNSVMMAASGINLSLDDIQSNLSTYTSLSASAAVGSVFKDINGRDVRITSEAQFNDFVRTYQEEAAKAENSLHTFLGNSTKNAATLKNLNDLLKKDGVTEYNAADIIDRDILGDGEIVRMTKMDGSVQTIRDAFRQGASGINYLNETEHRYESITKLDTFDEFDTLQNKAKIKTSQLDAQEARLDREREARQRNRNSNSSGGSH